MKEPKIYRGVDLLDIILELEVLTPNPSSWTLSAQKDNPPRLIRLKQIQSLISAFFPTSIGNGFIDKAKQLLSGDKSEIIQTVISGDFLLKQNITEFTELIKFMRAIVNKKENCVKEEREISIGELIMSYQELIKYKKQINKLLTFNSGWIETISTPIRFSIYLTGSISNELKDKYSELDKALDLFVNPKNLSFTENELIDKYNFPKDDLYDIDLEWT